MSFENVFNTGGSEAGSADKSTQALHEDTPGTGSVSNAVWELEKQRDPWLVRQTAHGALDVMGFLGPFFQKFQSVSADQRQVSEDPSSTSGMASSTMNKASESLSVKISDADLPNLGDTRSFVLITTGLGASEGLAVDSAQNTAYVADRAGAKITAVDLAIGAQRVVARNLGDIGDVAVDGAGKAYTTDYGGARLLAVTLADGSSSVVASVTGAYGVALSGSGTAYVVDYAEGFLFSVVLANGQKNTVASSLTGGVSGIALDGGGKAYVGTTSGTALYEVSLAEGTKRVVATLPGANRVALDGAGKAYVTDSGGHLYEVRLADGAQRVVASGLGNAFGVALDRGRGQIYISNHEGQLWRISQAAAQALGGVGKVAA
ncbi:NHL repeat-containing protein [Streptomyces celluloflavus]|uniref:hypothetical protein n=1 Tax=Streptomyces celluloflavus TaxID=58344 RepID=UPI0036B1A26F